MDQTTLADQVQIRKGCLPRKDHALGVLFVHGIGSQKRGDTLVQWGDVLANTVNRCAQGEVTAQVEAAQIVGTAANGEVRPAHAHLSLRTGGEPSSWLLAEAWWAEALTTPAYSQLVSWSVQSIPWALTVHFALRFRTLLERIKHQDRHLSKYLLNGEVLGNIGGFLFGLLAVPVLVTLLAVLLVVGQIPIPKLHSFIRTVQRKLAGTVGDSLILLESPIQSAAIRSTLRDAIGWLDNSCDRVAVVAHSQGAAISLEALGGCPSEELGGAHGYQPPTGLRTLVTFGSGINKLAAVKLLAKPSDDPEKSNPTNNPQPSPWVASLLLIVMFALGVGICYEVVSGQLTVWDAAKAGGYFLILFATLGIAALAGDTVKKLSGSERIQLITIRVVVLLGLVGSMYFIHVSDLSGYFVIGIGLLPLVTMNVIALLRGDFLERVGKTMRRPSWVETWADFYASADPVPNGETIVSGRSPISVEVWNSGSPFTDHTTYWRNIDGFVIPLIRCLAAAAGSPLAKHLPDTKDSTAARARLRVCWLQTARASVVLVGIGYLLVRWTALSRIGEELRSRVPTSFRSLLFIEIPTEFSDPTVSLIGASTVFLAGWIGYSLVRYSWWRWARSEQEVVARHGEPDGRPRRFWIFGATLAAVLSLALAVENVAMYRRLFIDTDEWIDLAGRYAGSWLGLTLVLLVPVGFLSWKGPLALRRSKSSGDRASLAESSSNSSGPPEPHAAFLRSVVDRLQKDSRLVGIAAGGSYLTQSIDEFSDLDLVIAVEPADYDTVLRERKGIADGIGPLLAAFTGEHVGEPRLLICLYGPPLLHVDLKFISLADAANRVEDPAVLWERNGRLTAALQTGVARYPKPDLQWIEDRFWIWIHYGAGKIGRGELFETIGFLAYLRSEVLGPLSLVACGKRPSGVRKLEFAAPDLARRMQATVSDYDAATCAAALRAAAEMYGELRAKLAFEGLRFNARAEEATMEYLADIEGRYKV